MYQRWIIVAIALMLCPLSYARTALYGEANAFGQVHNSDQGSTVELEGYLSHLGFRNQVAIAQAEYFFDIRLGFNVLGFSAVDRGLVYTSKGEIGVAGARGNLTLFYGDTPLSKSNQLLRLMDRDPDGLSSVFYASAAQPAGLAVGSGTVDGVAYRTPMLNERVFFDAAIVPAEVVGGETGYSLAGQFVAPKTTLFAAVEVNVEAEDTQLVRVMAQQQWSRVSLAAGVQWSANSQQDSQAQTYFAVAKFPWQIGKTETRAKTIISWNRLDDGSAEADSQMYLSFVDEWPLDAKTSIYGFAEVELANDLNDAASYTGVGLRMAF